MTSDIALPVNVGGLVNRDLLDMAFAGLSPTTLKLYRGDWKRFLAWAQLGSQEFFELSKAEAATTLSHYLTHLEHEGKAPATRVRAKQAVCSIVDRLYAADALPWTLAKLKILRSPNVRHYKDVEGLPPESWLALLAAAESDGTRRGARDVAILLLLHDSALRRREVATLDLEHYELDRARVHVWGKGRDAGDRDAVPVSPRAAGALGAWLTHRGDHPGALFTGLRDDAPITPCGVDYAVRYWCRKAHITEVGPHQLRHAAITQLARRGVLSSDLKRFARHASYDTTLHYVHTANDTVRTLTEMLGDDEWDEGEDQ